MKAMVTGGGGFLGGAIVKSLLAQGHAVASFARGSYPALDALGVQCFQGDLRDPTALHDAFKGFDSVFHVAALPGIWGPYQRYFEINTQGTDNVINACLANGIKKLVYTSTPSVVHGGGDIEGADESLPYPQDFEAAYPKTKALAEQAVLRANGPALATIALRPHLIWGPGDNHLLPRIIKRATQGRLRFLGPPSPLVDSTFIDDGARAHIMASEALGPNAPCAGKAYFISQGEPWPVDKLINGLLNAAGMKKVDKYVPANLALGMGALLEFCYSLVGASNEPPMTRFLAKQLSTAHWYDISAARRDFGFEPKYSIEQGLQALSAQLSGLQDARTQAT